MTLGQKIQIRREYLEITQDDLAKMIGVSRGTISNIENDGKDPSVFTILKICAVLDMDITYLLGDCIHDYQIQYGTVPEPDKYKYGTIYGNIKEECKKANINSSQLMRILKMDVRNMTNWKNGARPASITIRRISKYFGVTPKYLMTRH